MPTDTTSKPKSPTSSPRPKHSHLREDVEELKELIEKNIKWTQVVYEELERMKRRQRWMYFFSLFKILLILIPLILAFVYLPPLLGGALGQYQQLLGGSNAGGADLTDVLSNVSQDDVKGILEKLNSR